MRLGAMFSDALRSLFRRGATRQYPFERKHAPERLRGRLHWEADKCTGCCLCSKDCPANAIEVLTVDKAAKRFVVRYHVDRCTFCAQCILSCPQAALKMSNDEWELACVSKQPFTIYYGDEGDIERLMANLAASDDSVPEGE